MALTTLSRLTIHKIGGRCMILFHASAHLFSIRTPDKYNVFSPAQLFLHQADWGKCFSEQQIRQEREATD